MPSQPLAIERGREVGENHVMREETITTCLLIAALCAVVFVNLYLIPRYGLVSCAGHFYLGTECPYADGR